MWSNKAAYQIVELDAGRLPAKLALPAGFTGLAFVIRYHDQPVGFFMEPLASGTVLTARELAMRVMKSAGAQILSEKIRQDLAGPTDTPPLPPLDIVICTHNRADSLSRTLESLRRAGVMDSDENIRVVIVDNAPADDSTARLVAGFPKVAYILEPKPGLDFARNRAVREASGELIAFLDDDVTVDRGWLEGLRDAWRTNPDAAAFTGPVVPMELNTRAQILFEQMGGFGSNFQRVRFGAALPNLPTYPCGAGMFGAGCNMAFSRRVLLRLGGFDDALDTGAPLPGGGDLDMFYRVVRAGYSLVREPRLVVYHQHRREYAQLRHQMWTWGLGTMAYVVKTYREDTSQRSKLRRWILWWFSYQLSKIFVPFLRRNRKPWPWDLAFAEIAGGIVGLLGEYDRSRKRIEVLRKEYA
jgi:GT2 family glycosyltransferase